MLSGLWASANIVKVALDGQEVIAKKINIFADECDVELGELGLAIPGYIKTKNSS